HRTNDPLPLPERRHGETGELVRPLVLGVAGMALDPVPRHLVAAARLVQRLPQLGVLDRLPRGRLPAVPLPALDPARDAVLDVAGIGVEIDGARLLQRVQRLDRRHQLHAVVGGVGLAARQLLLHAVEAQDRAPAAGAGIAGAGPVGEYLDPLHGCFRPYSAAEAMARWKRSLRTYSSGSRFLTSAPSGPCSQS